MPKKILFESFKHHFARALERRLSLLNSDEKGSIGARLSNTEFVRTGKKTVDIVCRENNSDSAQHLTLTVDFSDCSLYERGDTLFSKSNDPADPDAQITETTVDPVQVKNRSFFDSIAHKYLEMLRLKQL
jgi:hypothetical protein